MIRKDETEKASENVRRLSALYSAVVADACDKTGRYDRVLSHRLRPVWPEAKLAGVARTQLVTAAYAPIESLVDRECDCIDTLGANDIVVATTNGGYDFAYWGELFATEARARGCEGAVVDGSIRDARRLIAMGFPTFSVGFSPGDTQGRCELVAVDVPISCGGVLIEPGDYIIGDIDGLVAVPKGIIEQVLEIAESKARGEDAVRGSLEGGRSIRETWNEYGIM